MADAAKAGQTNNTILIIGGIVILAVVLVIGWWAFNRNTEEAVETDLFEEEEASLTGEEPLLVTSAPTPTVTALSSPALSPSPVAGQVKSFTVAATNFAFTPKEIRVKEGDTVRLTLTNNSTMSHDWNLDEFNAATDVITNGQTDTVEFTAATSGTYEYYCSVGTHRQQGMVGKLIVE